MAKADTSKTARTYRLPNNLIEEMERVRNLMRVKPTETSMVETALWDFVKREGAEAKRSARG